MALLLPGAAIRAVAPSRHRCHPARSRAALNLGAFQSLRADVTAYLMDAGIRSKLPGTRHRPTVTPRHAIPGAYNRATASPLEARYLHYSHLNKGYPTAKGPLTVVQDFNLTLKRGEFVSLIGHSGCGKSTVLSITTGLTGVIQGEIALDGLHGEGADPERAVVFQSPNLFPWLTARQRVGIARAFALSPKRLLLDEPFGMFDSLTRWELQEVLMEVWSRTRVTTVCVTHDVDEAILLADRVVMMTNGPRATVGKITAVNLTRPRSRRDLLSHPDYYSNRAEIMGFLESCADGAAKEDAA